jgi:hypothetical protein
MMSAVGAVKSTNRGALGNENLDTEAALSAAGLSGTNLKLAYSLFSRTESLRQFLSIMSRGPDVINSFIKQLDEAAKNNALGQRAKLATNQSQIQLAANAQKNLNMQVVRGFDPVIHAIGNAMRGASNAALGHPDATTGLVTGLAGAQLASRVFLGFGLAGGAGRLLKRIPGLSKIPGLGRAVGSAPELAAAAVVGSGLGAFTSAAKGSRSDPFWVVVDPLSWFMPGAPNDLGGTSPKSGGGGIRFPSWLKHAATGGAGGLAVAARGLGTGALGLGGGAVAAALMVLSLGGDQGAPPAGVADALKRINARKDPLLHHYVNLLRTQEPGHFGGGADMIVSRFMKGQISAGRAEQDLFVEGEIKLHHDVTPEARKLLKIDTAEHVPVKLWSKSSGGGKPQHRGKNKSIRGQGAR